MVYLFPYKSYSFVHTRVEDLVKLGTRETEANFLLRDVYTLIFMKMNLSRNTYKYD